MTRDDLIAELLGPALHIKIEIPNGEGFEIAVGVPSADLAAFKQGGLSEADFMARYVVPAVSNLRRLAAGQM